MHRRFARALTAAAALLSVGLTGSAQPAAPDGFLAQFEWQMDDPLFGGLSAIHLGDDGKSVVLLSDAGAFARGQITRDAAGQITAVALTPFAQLKGLGDAPLAKGRDDSEGLAIDAQGTAYISFEGVARVLRYADLGGPAENLPTPTEFKAMQRNAALEALAIDNAGTLYTLPERSGKLSQSFPIYRFKSGVWDKELSLPRDGGFLPVAADFGPDGRLYVLHRQLHGLSGFSSRLVRFTVGAQAIGPVETLLQTPIGYHDNLEGLSIWRDGSGHLRATMIADNNYLPLFSSGIVEYRLPD